MRTSEKKPLFDYTSSNDDDKDYTGATNVLVAEAKENAERRHVPRTRRIMLKTQEDEAEELREEEERFQRRLLQAKLSEYTKALYALQQTRLQKETKPVFAYTGAPKVLAEEVVSRSQQKPRSIRVPLFRTTKKVLENDDDEENERREEEDRIKRRQKQAELSEYNKAKYALERKRIEEEEHQKKLQVKLELERYKNEALELLERGGYTREEEEEDIEAARVMRVKREQVKLERLLKEAEATKKQEEEYKRREAAAKEIAEQQRIVANIASSRKKIIQTLPVNDEGLVRYLMQQRSISFIQQEYRKYIDLLMKVWRDKRELESEVSSSDNQTQSLQFDVRGRQNALESTTLSVYALIRDLNYRDVIAKLRISVLAEIAQSSTPYARIESLGSSKVPLAKFKNEHILMMPLLLLLQSMERMYHQILEPNEIQKLHMCMLCDEFTRDVIFSCRHTASCFKCVVNMYTKSTQDKQNKCPVCRELITYVTLFDETKKVGDGGDPTTQAILSGMAKVAREKTTSKPRKHAFF